MKRNQRNFNYKFAIICYNVSCIFCEDHVRTVWEKVFDNEYGLSERLTKDEAIKIVKERNLELVVDNEHGKIYDRKGRF